MCKFLFRGDAPVQEAPDDFADADLFKPGDPIDVFDNSAVFGPDIVAPLFIVVTVTDMSASEGRLLCAPMIKPRDANGQIDRAKPIALIRSFGCNPDDLKPVMVRDELLAVLVQKSPKPSPLIIGDGIEVIG